ncbi:hypothetical protein [Bacillus sp. Marseille-Q1617]|uniref:hypothetical protein n=1 Tax=Bacillus sp. Marseille-Q1617 TaxID=2736887 RepID=UPI0015889A9C|nr:hypothetical protein [Bacillus sp. Marseille-Q1617]
MVVKISELPEKLAFTIGLSLILVSPIVLFVIPFGKWMGMIVQAVIWFIAVLFILSAADKRHSRTGKGK